MRGLHLDQGHPTYRTDLPDPPERPEEVTVQVLLAGICGTDLALSRGYMGFKGVPGHEFVGRALDGPLAGQRVVGEINAACRRCRTCSAGLVRHCSNRTVLGILGRSGAFAERLSLPPENLHAVPAGIPDERVVFVEPLAAAFEILQQLPDLGGAAVLVAGDGRLGLLCAQVLHLAGARVTLAGHHPERAALIPAAARFETGLREGAGRPGSYDVVVEATGRPEVLPAALAQVRPRGTLVLKTTAERPVELDPAPIVVDEINVLGSRCGPFEPALEALTSGEVAVDPLIQARYPLEQGLRALQHAARPGTLKVLLEVD